MEQLSLRSLLIPPSGPTVAFDAATIDAVVSLMAEAMVAVFHAGGVDADDAPRAKP
jgi:hypothetical protein